MSISPQRQAGHNARSFFRQPLVIAIGVALLWVLLVIASEQMWQHAFGFSAGDSLALAVGLFAYLALFGGVMAGIIWVLGHEHMRNG